MKKPLLSVLAGAALFAGGWLTGNLTTAPVPASHGTRLAQISKQTGLRENESPTGAHQDFGKVRPFTAGRPFPRGGAREWILSLTPGLKGDRRCKYISSVRYLQMFATMDADSVKEAMSAISELTAIEDAKNPKRRNNPNGDGVLDVLMEFSIVRLAQLNPDEGLESLKRNYSLNDGSTKMLVMGMLAATDPARVEQMALALEKKEQQSDAMKALLYGMMSQGPAVALAFADRHPDLVDNKEREHILEGWVRTDPGPAMEAAVQATAKSGHTELIRNTIEEWSKVDAAAAARWAAGYEGPGSITAKAMVLERRLQENPAAAAAEYGELQKAATNPGELSRLTSALADAWAGKDVNAARAWAETLPAGDLHDRAMHQVVEEWVKHDAPAASEWLRAQPSGTLRDNAAGELARAISRSDPPGAFEWARSIADEPQRRRTLEHVLQQWREQDPDAAGQAAKTLPVEFQKQRP